MSEDILLVDKPIGITSFDVIRQLRRQLGIKKMGHAGTLDPLASGLMIIGINTGTKKLKDYIKLDKEYEAEILLGQKRTTGDMEGDVMAQKDVKTLVPAETISNTLHAMQGELTLPVSAYSAIKKDGIPMYKRARAAERLGETVADVPARIMQVHEAELLTTAAVTLDNLQFQLLTVRFAVGSGTYIRSLAEELGSRLGYPACVYNLRRTKVGEFEIADAKLLEAINK